jgi:hypothetical protein
MADIGDELACKSETVPLFDLPVTSEDEVGKSGSIDHRAFSLTSTLGTPAATTAGSVTFVMVRTAPPPP